MRGVLARSTVGYDECSRKEPVIMKTKIAMAAVLCLVCDSSSAFAHRCKSFNAARVNHAAPAVRMPAMAAKPSPTITDKYGIIRDNRGEPIGTWGIDYPRSPGR